MNLKVRILFILLTMFLLVCVGFAQEGQQADPFFQLPGGLRVYKNLAYAPGENVRQKLDIYVPGKREGPLPLIVWIHGGGWIYGSKENPLPLPWLGRGYVIASINYRLSQEAKFPAQIEDCKAAIRWLRSHADRYKIDPNRVAVWGESAGGHLASLLGTAGDVTEWDQGQPVGSSRVQAVINWFGPTDLTWFSTGTIFTVPLEAVLLGGRGEEVAKLARKASPISYVSKDDPPFLIMHGDKDSIVPLRQSKAFALALTKAGVKVYLRILKGADHGGAEFLHRDQLKVVDVFLTKHLRGQPGMEPH
jgi:acetyl esterase/lipase